MARRYVKVVGVLAVLLSVLALTVVAAQAKAGTGLGMSVLKLVAGHEEGVRLSQAPAMNGLSDEGCGMSCGDHATGATRADGEAAEMDCGAGEAAEMDCGAGEAAEMDCGAGEAAEMDCGAGEAAEMDCGAMDMTPTRGASEAAEMDCGAMDMTPTRGASEAAQMHCGPMDMGPQCGGELGCGFEAEAEADKSEAPDSIPAE